MAICMTRVDFRMIHGQVASVWIPHYSATKVVIIDDQTSKDNFVKQILIFAAPKGTTVEFYNVEDGVAQYQKDQFGNGKVIVLFRSIEQAYVAYQKGFKFESINIGQTPRGSDLLHATATVYVSAQDVHQLIDLKDQGVYVYFRQEISKPEVQLDTVVKKLSSKI